MNRKKSQLKDASSWQELLVRGGGEIGKASFSLWFFWGMWIVVMIMLLSRAIELQIVEGSFHRKRADENRIITRRVMAERGIITDRNGEVLVRNVPTYKRLVPGTVLAEGKFETIDKEQAMSLTVSDDEWIFFDIGREYLYPRVMAPVVGYVGEVSTDELEVLGQSYLGGDLIGKMGVEKLYESDLRGTLGIELVEVNSKGEITRKAGIEEAAAGRDIRLSIDLNLQQKLYDLMDGYTGAAVATDPNSGEVLALVSRPVFDANDIVASLEEEGEPFFNRAIGGAYPPGSVFKLITAIAGLEEGKIDKEFTVVDEGEIRIGEYRYGNWYFDQYGRTEGEVDIVKGIQRSNDIYFYKVGELVGARKLSAWARLFGLGQKTDIGLASEVDGLVPSPEWKERFIGARWFLGNTYHFAIGQGDLQVTPLQMNMAVSVMANGGRLCKPRLERGDVGLTMGCQELGISSESIDLIVSGMKKACEVGGTAFPFFDFEPKVACKTGTAEFGDPEDNTHAWFSIFAPADDPQIVLTVLLEGAGEGSSEAAPVAKEALEYWFTKRE